MRNGPRDRDCRDARVVNIVADGGFATRVRSQHAAQETGGTNDNTGAGLIVQGSGHGNAEPFRVVLADDVADLRFLLTRALHASGRFDVVGTAANGRDAIEQATQLQPDVTLLDLAMPVMDGLEALPAIRAAVPECTVVVLSGFDAQTMAAPAMERGAAGYLVKGLSPHAVVRDLIALLDTLEHQPATTTGDELARAQIDLPAQLTSGWQARLFLADRLREWHLEPVLDDALLLTTELVTNAVIHARSAVSVTVRRGVERLRIEVADTGPGALRFRGARDDAQTGRGLQLLEAIASSWGTSAFEAGKLVWFELSTAATPRHA